MHLFHAALVSFAERREIIMNKKKVLALMAMLTVTVMVSACGGKKEEAAVTETQAVESTVVESTVEESTAAENTDETESTEQAIEEDTDVALAESVEETEEEMSVVEKNTKRLREYILYPDQAVEAAQALEELGFGEIKDVKEPDSISRNVIDEKGMVLQMYYGQIREYYLNIYAAFHVLRIHFRSHQAASTHLKQQTNSNKSLHLLL